MEPQSLIEKVGLPGAIALIVLWYLRKDVVLPLVGRILGFFDQLDLILDAQAKRAIVDEAIQGDIDRRLGNLESKAEYLCEMMHEVARKLKLTGRPLPSEPPTVMRPPLTPRPPASGAS